MSRLDDVLNMKNVADEAKDELVNAKQAVRDLKSLAMVAESEGGKQLYNILKEDCRDILLKLLNAKAEFDDKKVMALLSDFEAKFTLFNTLKSAPQDYEEAEDALEERVDEILES